ncbi:MAG: hypothetical protein BWX84_02729 [Verrucomicrobia bacterium ADurb.Bin118]|nr:MAG: hypothetical protein BWX84_02729 [Verrucomicrobia bacterium ADurb.Bin118]
MRVVLTLTDLSRDAGPGAVGIFSSADFSYAVRLR